VRREERDRPAVLAGIGAPHHRLHQRPARLLDTRLLLRVRSREVRPVGGAVDPDPHVGLLHRPLRRRGDPVELSVGRELVEGGLSALGGELEHRVSARAEDLLVDGLDQRLRGRARLAHAHVALCHLRRVADEYLRQRIRALVPHAADSCTRRADAASTSQRCSRSSGVSSGWNATAVTSPSRTATGWPSTSARTVTAGPQSSTHGARMNTARSGPPSRPSSSRSVSKLFTWRPNALRRVVRSSTPRWLRSSMINPAHVASVGVPDSSSARSGSASASRSNPSVIVVDSPPGRTRPSSPASSSGPRTIGASAPSVARTVACASKSPWRAITPILIRDLPAPRLDQPVLAEGRDLDAGHRRAQVARRTRHALGIVEVRRGL